jgi:hypothetical protein
MDIQTLLIILAIGAVAGWLVGDLGRWFDWSDNHCYGRCCCADFCAETG